MRHHFRTLQYLIGGSRAFVIWLVSVNVGGWYFLTGYFGEPWLGWWRPALEYLFVVLTLLFIFTTTAGYASRRRRVMRRLEVLPLRADVAWPAGVWAQRFEDVGELDARVAPECRWAARQLRHGDQARPLTRAQLARWLSYRARPAMVLGLIGVLMTTLAVRPEAITERIEGWLDGPDRRQPFLIRLELCGVDRAQCSAQSWRQMPGGSVRAEMPAEYSGWLRLSLDTGPRTRRRVTARVTDQHSSVGVEMPAIGSEATLTLLGRRADVFYVFRETKFQTTIAIDLETAGGRPLEAMEITLTLRDPSPVSRK